MSKLSIFRVVIYECEYGCISGEFRRQPVVRYVPFVLQVFMSVLFVCMIIGGLFSPDFNRVALAGFLVLLLPIMIVYVSAAYRLISLIRTGLFPDYVPSRFKIVNGKIQY